MQDVLFHSLWYGLSFINYIIKLIGMFNLICYFGLITYVVVKLLYASLSIIVWLNENVSG